MANEWTIDPSNPRQYIYTAEDGTVHRAPVYKEDVSVVHRDNNGNITDVTFPNYKQPSNQPATQQPAPPAERRGWGERFSSCACPFNGEYRWLFAVWRNRSDNR